MPPSVARAEYPSTFDAQSMSTPYLGVFGRLWQFCHDTRDAQKVL
jgi:hypothetical protein